MGSWIQKWTSGRDGTYSSYKGIWKLNSAWNSVPANGLILTPNTSLAQNQATVAYWNGSTMAAAGTQVALMGSGVTAVAGDTTYTNKSPAPTSALPGTDSGKHTYRKYYISIPSGTYKGTWGLVQHYYDGDNNYYDEATLYYWQPTKYTINVTKTTRAGSTAISANSGVVSISGGTAVQTGTISINEGETVTLTARAYTGYTFKGWATSSTATSYLSTATTYTPKATSSTTYYGIFQANTYTITYDANGGTSAPGNGTKYHNVTFTLTSSKPKAPTGSWSFKGWSTTTANALAGTTTTTYSGNANATFYACWQRDVKQAYSLNGGSGTKPETQSLIQYRSGSSVSTVTFAAQSINATRQGYYFTGWGTSATGGATYSTTDKPTWAPSATTTSLTRTLYAQWSANSYTLTANPNNGQIPNPTAGWTVVGNPGYSASKTVYYNSKIGSLPVPTRLGYTFANWYTSSTGGSLVNADTVYGNTSNSEIYAHWTPNKYTVTFNKQNGSGGSNSVEATYTQSMPSATMPTRVGYTFEGYFDSNSTPTKYYNANGTSAHTWDKTSAATLYAYWDVNSSYIQYNASGLEGAEVPSNKSYTYEDRILGSNLDNPELIPSGYEFVGWSSSRSNANSGIVYGPNDTVREGSNGTEPAVITLYASWKTKITFHANGSGADFPSDVITDKTDSYFYTESVLAPGPSDFVPYGYRYWTFTDWTTEAGGGGTAYNPNAVVKSADSYGIVHDLYAHSWQKGNTVYAMFNPTSGSLSFELREGGVADGTDDGYGEIYYRGEYGVEDTSRGVPWASIMSQIKSVRFETDVTPISTANWFNGATQLTEFSTTTTISNGNGQEETKGLKGNNLASMSAMFRESGVQTVNFDDNFIFSELNDPGMNNVFNGCESLISVNFGARRFIPPSTLKSMANLFKGCQSLTTITNLITTGITSFNNLFNGCSQLPNDILNSIDISSAENLISCYEGCTKLTSFNLTIPANEISIGRMFYGCTELSGNIKVKNTFISSTSNIFAQTKNDIYVVNTDSADTITWRVIAAGYTNVHFEADDNPPPTIGKVSTYERGTLSGNTFDNTEESGTAIRFTVGACDTVSHNETGAKLPENFTEGEGADTVTYNWDNKTYSIKVLMNGQIKYSKPGIINTEEVVQFDTEDTKRHVLQLVITDAVGKSSTRLIIVTPPTATIDFKAGGEGVAIGTFASQNGFNVQMPTMVGKGLKFYSQCVIRRIKLFQCNKYETHTDDETLSDLKYIPYAMKDNDLVTIAYTWYDGTDASSTPLEFTKNTVTKINGETRCYLDPPGLSASTPVVRLNGGQPLTMVAPTTVPTSEAAGYLNQVFYEMMRDTWVDISEPQLVVGKYNLAVKDALLVIGNGTDDRHRSNSLVIDKDGNFESKTYDDLVVNDLLVKGRARVVNGTLLGGVYSTATTTLPASGWSDNTQSIEVVGVTASNIVMVTPAPNSAATWSGGGVICSGQAQDTLSFSCEVEPTSDIDVNVIIL